MSLALFEACHMVSHTRRREQFTRATLIRYLGFKSTSYCICVRLPLQSSIPFKLIRAATIAVRQPDRDSLTEIDVVSWCLLSDTDCIEPNGYERFEAWIRGHLQRRQYVSRPVV